MVIHVANRHHRIFKFDTARCIHGVLFPSFGEDLRFNYGANPCATSLLRRSSVFAAAVTSQSPYTDKPECPSHRPTRCHPKCWYSDLAQGVGLSTGRCSGGFVVLASAGVHLCCESERRYCSSVPYDGIVYDSGIAAKFLNICAIVRPACAVSDLSAH